MTPMTPSAPGGKAAALRLSSPAFQGGTPIPTRFTCDGQDVSPPLQWSGAPSETRSFALVCDDPDAPRGTWLHWLLYNLPGDTGELAEGVPPQAQLPSGARQGTNDFGNVGYGGPCPPPGRPHRYFFRLYALDAPLSSADDSRAALDAAMRGHLLAESTLMGTYQRRH